MVVRLPSSEAGSGAINETEGPDLNNFDTCWQCVENTDQPHFSSC